MRGLVCALVTMLVGGCGGSEACADLSDDVLLTAQMTDNGERARVEVELRRPDLEAGSIPVKLCEGHGLRVDDIVMTEAKRPSGAIIYEANLGPDPGPGPITRHFVLRAHDDVSEFTAVIDAPGFTITGPTAASELSRADALAISWDPPRGGDARVSIKVADEIDGDACLGEPVELEEPDDGEASVEGAQVKLSPDKPPANGECEAFVTLSRSASAPLELASGPGGLHPDSVVQATTSRSVRFLSVP